MLAVTQFFEADDMAFVLDRMLARENPMRARLNSGHYFVRYVVIEEEAQRRSICAALNQWIANSGEKISGIGAHFATSLELTEVRAESNVHVGRTLLSASPESNGHVVTGASPLPLARSAADPLTARTAAPIRAATPDLDSGSASNIHCPQPLPSGF
jgi:hypothetical protein